MERLARWLEETNTTHAALAEQVGVTTSAVTHWVTGRYMPKVNKLRELERITGIPIGELIGSGEERAAV